jgi:hypothetical protein
LWFPNGSLVVFWWKKDGWEKHVGVLTNKSRPS